MRNLMTLTLAGAAALVFALAFDASAQDDFGSPVAYAGVPDTAATWRSAPAATGRLSYLNTPACPPGGCVAAAPDTSLAERDFIKSLSLGTYGPMDFKFTGDRVKLKVRF